jgi:hypothetical protein
MDGLQCLSSLCWAAPKVRRSVLQSCR